MRCRVADKLQASGVVPVDIDLLHNHDSLSLLPQLYLRWVSAACTCEWEKGDHSLYYIHASFHSVWLPFLYFQYTNIRVSNQQLAPTIAKLNNKIRPGSNMACACETGSKQKVWREREFAFDAATEAINVADLRGFIALVFFLLTFNFLTLFSWPLHQSGICYGAWRI